MIVIFWNYFSYLKQSPRFLMTKGRCEEAAEVIRKIAEKNKKPVPSDLLQKLKVKNAHCINK